MSSPSPRRTLADLLQYLAPGATWEGLARWPPDVFAVAGAALADSGAYRLTVSPPQERRWPPPVDPRRYPSWAEQTRAWGSRWADATEPDKSGAPPPSIEHRAQALDAAGSLPLASVCEGPQWEVATALVTLFAAADEACAGIASGQEALQRPFHLRAQLNLVRTGSCATLDPERIRVVPKLRVPESGITVRSLSRYVAFHRSEVETRWYTAAPPQAADAEKSAVTLLVVPWPAQAFPTDFRPVTGSPSLPVAVDPDRFGFFEFEPQQQFDVDAVERLVQRTRRTVGAVDIVVLPESVLRREQAESLHGRLLEMGVEYLVAGVREEVSAGRFGANYAYVGGGWPRPSWSVEQHKHHRWFLDRWQIRQYHLGSALAATRTWWEAIDVRARSLTFVEIQHSIVVCPLICEDLARPDPVGDVIRAVGPSLVIALLLDGPQLAARWPARYATVLADDPGSAVLTVSSLGLVVRCRPPGKPRSRTVALWKDRRGVPIEIDLEDGSEAIALTASVESSRAVTADGRSEARSTVDLVLTGIEQIRPVHTGDQTDLAGREQAVS